MALKPAQQDNTTYIDMSLRTPMETTWRLAQVLTEHDEDATWIADIGTWYANLWDAARESTLDGEFVGSIDSHATEDQMQTDSEHWERLTSHPLVELTDSELIVVHEHPTWGYLDSDIEETYWRPHIKLDEDLQWLLGNFTTVPYDIVETDYVGGEDLSGSTVFDKVVLALSLRHTERYFSDLFWTARQMPDHYFDGEKFYLGIRTYGVDYYNYPGEFAKYMKIVGTNGGDNRFFRVQIHKADRDKWTAEITEVVSR